MPSQIASLMDNKEFNSLIQEVKIKEDGKVKKSRAIHSFDELMADMQNAGSRFSQNGYYVLMFQRALEALSIDQSLAPSTLRVFLYLLAKMDYSNRIYLKQTQIIDELKMAKSTVSIAINCLINKGIIRVNRENREKFYILNELFGWKGCLDDLMSSINKTINIIEKENDRLEKDYREMIGRNLIYTCCIDTDGIPLD